MNKKNYQSGYVLLSALMFLGAAAFDVATQKRDQMTFVFAFLGILGSLVATALQRIEKRLSTIEERLQSRRSGLQDCVKEE
jgi:hypothetical protein